MNTKLPINSKSLLLSIIGLPESDLSGELGGITRLQKLVFLLEREYGIQASEDQEFVPYKAGPYSAKLYNTFGVPDIERAFGDIGVDSPETFFKHICDCVICKGVIDQDISNFRNFGNQYSSDPNTKKQLTVAATECTRYHYLLCKVKEKKYIQNASLETIIKDLKNSLHISSEIDTLKSEHILRWIKSLDDKKKE